jgi:hypothetical protein
LPDTVNWRTINGRRGKETEAMTLREIFLNVRLNHPELPLEDCRKIARETMSELDKKRLNGRPLFKITDEMKAKYLKMKAEKAERKKAGQ